MFTFVRRRDNNRTIQIDGGGKTEKVKFLLRQQIQLQKKQGDLRVRKTMHSAQIEMFLASQRTDFARFRAETYIVPIHQSNHPSIHITTHSFNHPSITTISPSRQSSIIPFIHPSIPSTIHPSSQTPTHLSVYPSIH